MSRSRGNAQPPRHARTKPEQDQPATPPGELPPGLTRDPAQPLRSVESPQDAAAAMEAAVQALLEQGRIAEAAELRARQQQAAAQAAERERVRKLLADDPVSLIFELLGAVQGAVQTAVAQAPPRSGITCHTCFMTMATWEAKHMGDLKAAHAKACEAAGLAPGDPRGAGIGLDAMVAHLPPEMHPGGPEAPPQQFQVVDIVNGTGFCAPHVPGNPAAVAMGAQSALIRVSGYNVHQAAQFAMAGMPSGMG